MSTAQSELARTSAMFPRNDTRSTLHDVGRHRGDDDASGLNEEAILLVVLEQLIDARVDARLTQLADRLSAKVAAAIVDRLSSEGSGLGAGDDRLLTVSAAAKLLSLSRSTVYELIKGGELAAVRVGGARRITAEALAAFRTTLTDLPLPPTPPSGERAPVQ